ncbi:hypothetical protein CTM88_05225 [Photobacterium aquimaris]|uniref:Uncharacterized protein n=1 Tax=Photobacterium aquimaris TaxID=512643 RepID=A0A2T3IQ11_9GAMM|nr:hypothetical protein AYY20_06015 [Photobacterium aquimaris]PSU30412.1 hypothetical protein CTM88_05225 [Photobacterium aquimaris]
MFTFIFVHTGVTFQGLLFYSHFNIIRDYYKHIAYGKHNNTDAYLWQAKVLTFLKPLFIGINNSIINT